MSSHSTFVVQVPSTLVKLSTFFKIGLSPIGTENGRHTNHYLHPCCSHSVTKMSIFHPAIFQQSLDYCTPFKVHLPVLNPTWFFGRRKMEAMSKLAPSKVKTFLSGPSVVWGPCYHTLSRSLSLNIKAKRHQGTCTTFVYVRWCDFSAALHCCRFFTLSKPFGLCVCLFFFPWVPVISLIVSISRQ